ncbi:MAG: response regulator transcription factor [Candidatus Cryosericum sp.]
MRVLVVEDERDLADGIAAGLRRELFTVDVALDGCSALEKVHIEQGYDVIVLDLRLPKLSGMAVLEHLRHEGVQIPVLVLTAADEVDTKLEAFHLGTDDYLTKPFSFAELLARIHALLRRGTPPLSGCWRVDGLTLDPASHVCKVDGRTVCLTDKETQLLEYLFRNAGRLIPQEELEQHMWDDRSELWAETLKVHMHRLRAKIGDTPARPIITTVRSEGYGILTAVSVIPRVNGDGKT